MGFTTQAEYEEYYRHRCRGDMRHLLDPEDYEYPRVAWLLERVVGSVIDVGCGTGDVCGHLAATGVRCLGIDPGRCHIETARERYPKAAFVCCFAEEYAERFATGTAGTVLCGDVIEHVPDDKAFLACLRRLGKQVLITTPNGPWPSPEHLRVYTPETAVALVEPYGGAVDVIADRKGQARWLGLAVGS